MWSKSIKCFNVIVYKPCCQITVISTADKVDKIRGISLVTYLRADYPQ